MPSKQVLDRKKSAQSLDALVGAAAKRAGASIRERFAPHVKRGEEQPDWELVLTLIARQVANAARVLGERDDAHARELSDDDGPRRARDDAYELGREVGISGRDLVQGAYGDAGLAVLQMSEPAPVDPNALADWLTTARDALRDEARKLPKPLRRAAKLDREALAEEFDEVLRPLVPALKAVAKETREAQTTLVEKDRAMADFDGAYSENCSALSALLRVAGEHELAARTRPTVRRAEGDGEGEGEGGGGEGGGGGEKKKEEEKPVKEEGGKK